VTAADRKVCNQGKQQLALPPRHRPTSSRAAGCGRLLSLMQAARFLLLTVLLWLTGRVWAYVPASPTNSTDDAIRGGLNVTDVSQLHLQWYSNGCVVKYALYQRRLKGGERWYWDSSPVSYQLVGLDSQGISEVRRTRNSLPVKPYRITFAFRESSYIFQRRNRTIIPLQVRGILVHTGRNDRTHSVISDYTVDCTCFV
jgi:hypothetical protein